MASQKDIDRRAYGILSAAGFTEETLYGTKRRALENRELELVDINKNGVIWAVGEEVSGDLTMLDLRIGEMQLSMDMTSDHTRLTWDAYIPKHLRPEQTADTFVNGFLPTVLHQIPDRGYSRTTAFIDTSEVYRKGSSISLTIDGEQRDYKLNIAAQRLQFGVDFLRPNGKVNAFSFDGLANEGPPNAYDLVIQYGEKFDRRGVMSLEFPYYKDTNPLWNPSILQWVLDTHAFFPNDANKAKTADALSGILQSYILVKKPMK